MLIVIGFFVASVLMAMDLNSFNKFFDVFVPIYSVAAVFFIAYSVRKGKQPTAEESNGRIYTFKKKNKLDALNWKQRFAGVWEKIERKGIYEFMLFSGAPSIIAYAQRDSNYGQVIESKDDENSLSIEATGFPPLKGTWMPVGTTQENSTFVAAKDPAGRPVSGKMWWDEGEKCHNAYIENPGLKQTSRLKRWIDENDVLHLIATNTKQTDGSSCTFECTFRRTGQADVIYTNKEMYNRPHYTTNHGKFGLVVMLVYVSLGLAGAVFLHPDFGIMKSNQVIRKFHRFAGLIFTAGAWLCCCSGFATLHQTLLERALFAIPLSIMAYFVLL